MNEEYILDGRVVSYGELPALFPGVSLPAVIDDDSAQAIGISIVQAVTPPDAGPQQSIERDGVEEANGVWYQRWVLRDLTADEIASRTKFLRDSLMAAATGLRWERETGGITVGGSRVDTTRADQDSINRVLSRAPEAGISLVNFKASSGWVRGMPIEQLRQIAIVIARHVQACYDAEMAHHDVIEQLPADELASYDVTQGWPA